MEQYLDKPEKDGTKEAHPAWWRAHHSTMNVCIDIFTGIVSGKDDKTRAFSNANLEKVRRAIWLWKETLEEMAEKNTTEVGKKAKAVLKETNELIS